MSQEREFQASIVHLHEMLFFIKNYCKEKGFNSSSINKIMVAAEEAIVNVIRHGYFNQPKGTIEIICEECENKPGIRILIKDYGIPFNPVDNIEKIKEHHSQKNAEEHIVGGYGIFLYLQIMDKVEYKRDGQVNLLHLIKYLD